MLGDGGPEFRLGRGKGIQFHRQGAPGGIRADNQELAQVRHEHQAVLGNVLADLFALGDLRDIPWCLITTEAIGPLMPISGTKGNGLP